MPAFSLRDYFFTDQATAERLDGILHLLGRISHKQDLLMIDTSKLIASVSAAKGKVDSLIALATAQSTAMKDLAKQLADAIAAGDPAALAQVQADLDKAATDLDAESAAVQAALDANSNPAPAPSAPPTP
jgi:fatty acid-binding protein DegV